MTEEIEMEVLSMSGSSEDDTWRQPHQFPERINFRLHPSKTEVTRHHCGICDFVSYVLLYFIMTDTQG